MCIKVETAMSECERAAKADVFKTGDTAHKTHTTCSLQMFVCSAALLALSSN
jgi:hypothetical protein